MIHYHFIWLFLHLTFFEGKNGYWFMFCLISDNSHMDAWKMYSIDSIHTHTIQTRNGNLIVDDDVPFFRFKNLLYLNWIECVLHKMQFGQIYFNIIIFVAIIHFNSTVFIFGVYLCECICIIIITIIIRNEHVNCAYCENNNATSLMLFNALRLNICFPGIHLSNCANFCCCCRVRFFFAFINNYRATLWVRYDVKPYVLPYQFLFHFGRREREKYLKNL